eukprot:SAG31_NODE_1587_length_7819_cov_3.703277_3_plen_113_part_00
MFSDAAKCYNYGAAIWDNPIRRVVAMGGYGANGASRLDAVLFYLPNRACSSTSLSPLFPLLVRLDDETVERMPPVTDGASTDVGVDRFTDIDGAQLPTYACLASDKRLVLLC